MLAKKPLREPHSSPERVSEAERLKYLRRHAAQMHIELKSRMLERLMASNQAQSEHMVKLFSEVRPILNTISRLRTTTG
ncbi:MAG: hypothetical protein PHD95_03520, partial [Candidatus ainarchaeum sp.]|nr:hypothetical protein [Candidatus ainarchaeum sp.]